MPSQTILAIETRGPGLYEFTSRVAAFVEEAGETGGLLTLFVRHTSCSLLIQENADPDVRADLDAFFRRLVPSADDPAMAYLVHRDEGPDDMPAHIKAALTPVSLSIPGRWAAGCCSAPGRASICSSTARGRTGARSPSTSRRERSGRRRHHERDEAPDQRQHEEQCREGDEPGQGPGGWARSAGIRR